MLGAFMWGASWRVWAGLAAAAAVGGVWLCGHHAGAEAVTEAWAASDREREAAEISAREQQRQLASEAAAGYEAAKARNVTALASARADLKKALQRPICPLAGPVETNDVQTLADLPIPAAAVDRLRVAAAGGDAR